jgi:hypothetical protein
MPEETDLAGRLRALVFHAEHCDKSVESDAQVLGCEGQLKCPQTVAKGAPKHLVGCLQGAWLQLQSFLHAQSATDSRADHSTHRLQRLSQEKLVQLQGQKDHHE